MSEQEKCDSRDLATLLKGLSKEDRLHAQLVISGMKLARKIDKLIEEKKTGASEVDNR